MIPRSLAAGATPTTRVVAIVVLDGVEAFDLSLACEMFGRVRLANGHPGYSVRVCGVRKKIRGTAFDVHTRSDLRGLKGADLVVLPGVYDFTAPVPAKVVRAVRDAAARGSRVASFCSGTFVLAATGLLDGLRATTHWYVLDELARQFPNVDVTSNVLYIDNGQILTSAGVASGLEFCLHIIRRDYGSAVAASMARIAVMPLERHADQAQFIVHEQPGGDGGSLAPLLQWLHGHIQEPLTLKEISRHAGLTARTLSRRFLAQTGTTPLQWLLRLRVRRAQHLLESTDLSVEQIASQVGFGSAITLRQRFHKLVGTSPQSHRRTFRGSNATI